MTAAQTFSATRRMRYTVGAQALVFAIVLVAGCNAKNSQDDQQIRQQAAQATADVKQGAKQAGEQIKQGAATAERKLDAVAAGVKDGLKTPAPGEAEAVDINSATAAKLTTLPGVGSSEARKIIRNRPYDRAHDLVSKGVMDEEEFAKVAARVVVR